MLPALKNYVPGVAFEGTRDVRVVDHAKTLRVAVWLHRLDMAMGGEALASETLEALRHCLGPLLKSFLTPRTSNLTFQEVVDCILGENRWASLQSLHHLRGRHVHDCEVLDGHPGDDGQVSHGAQAEMTPALGADDSQFHHGAQAETAPAPGANNAPSESAMTPATPASDPPPVEDQTQDMEVDNYGTCPCPPSPVSHEDDDLLMGQPQSEVTEVESGLAHLTVSSPRGLNGEGEEASN